MVMGIHRLPNKDVLYGEDIPWYGFNKLEPPSTPYTKGKWEAIHLAYRRGVKRKSTSLIPLRMMTSFKNLHVLPHHIFLTLETTRSSR